MPIAIILTTPQEMIQRARELSDKIVKLSDLNATPLAPGETADARRHQIAKFGKALAEAFIAIDKIMDQLSEHLAQHHSGDVTADAPKSSDPDPNAN